MHEYTMVGHPRAKIIFIIAFISIFISPLITKLIHNSFQNYFNVVITMTISSSSTFSLLYLIFDKYCWRWKLFQKTLCFPNLNGVWQCEGVSYKKESNETFQWNGKVIVKQTWDKMLITLQTSNSTSQSISVIGGIKHYPGCSYKLSYHYENKPNVSSPELKRHEGFCELDFAENLTTAKGYYFNNSNERSTYGNLNLTRGE